MKIESISRKISGFDYDNISATATLEDNEDPIEAAKNLDSEIRKMLAAITDQREIARVAHKEQEETVSLLERALGYAKEQNIPF